MSNLMNIPILLNKINLRYKLLISRSIKRGEHNPKNIVKYPGALSDILYIYIYAFIQSNLQCIQAIHLFCQYMCSLGVEPTNFCAVNAMLYHWATVFATKGLK